MCLILLAYRTHPDYELILLANRDEFYARPTQPAHWWEDNASVLAGKDLKAGGTWLGVNRQGQLAALTNFRDPGNFRPLAASRGALVAAGLTRATGTLCQFGQDYLTDVSAYNDFNLLLYRERTLYYFSGRGDAIEEVDPGVHGLSNHRLNTPWPKVISGKERLHALLSGNHFSMEAAFHLLEDRTEAPATALPDTGVGVEMERHLSPLHIDLPGYGTRSSNVVLFHRNGEVEFHEKDHLDGQLRSFRFTRETS